MQEAGLQSSSLVLSSLYILHAGGIGSSNGVEYSYTLRRKEWYAEYEVTATPYVAWLLQLCYDSGAYLKPFLSERGRRKRQNSKSAAGSGKAIGRHVTNDRTLVPLGKSSWRTKTTGSFRLDY